MDIDYVMLEVTIQRDSSIIDAGEQLFNYMSKKASGEFANIFKPEDNEPEVIGIYLVLVYDFILIK